MRPSVLVFAPLLACGSSPPPKAPSNSTASAKVARATLADDVAALRAAVTAATPTWPQRATFLGWTADHRVAYRLLMCAPDPLGGRGDYCDFDVCVAEPATGDQVPAPTCESAASFELGDPEAFDVVATTAAAEAAVAKLGRVAAGTSAALDSAGLVVEGGALYVALDGARRVIHARDPDLEIDGSNLATGFTADFVGVSPDGACRVALGRYTYVGWYEGVTGDIPVGFAAVTCR